MTDTLQVLTDTGRDGKERPWRDKKMANEHLAEIYLEVDKAKAARLADCATFLTYRPKADGAGIALQRANFCRVRLCPMCTWRRSLKVFGQLSRIMEALKGEYAYILLTLTVKNVQGEELGQRITDMMKGWQRFTQRKAYKKAVKGHFRAMEITHNLKLKSKHYDTYHPHFHVILAVKPTYFKDRTYLSHRKWQVLWKEAMRVEYDPVVNVKRIKGDDLGAVAEVAKYAVKYTDIVNEDYDMTLRTVRLLDEALNNRRFVAMGGTLKEMHKKLNLDDIEDGDLVQIEEDKPETTARELAFVWHAGYRQYLGD